MSLQFNIRPFAGLDGRQPCRQVVLRLRSASVYHCLQYKDRKDVLNTFVPRSQPAAVTVMEAV